MDVTKEMFQEWKDSKVSKEVFKVVEQRIEALLEALGDGIALNDPTRYADHVGRIQAYRDVLYTEYED